MIAVGDTFPSLDLPALGGVGGPLGDVWRAGTTLVVYGHRTCSTSRLTLPFVDRIHQQGGRVLAVLQDVEDEARALVAQQALTLPIRLEADPYPLASAIDLTTVPVLFLVEPDGRVSDMSKGFRKADVESFAARLGVSGVFGAEEKVPALRPG